MFDYLSFMDLNNLSDDEKIFELSSLVNKIERAISVKKRYDLEQEYVKVDEDLYIVKGISYYDSCKYKSNLLYNYIDLNFYNKIINFNRNLSAKKRRCRAKLNEMCKNFHYVYFMTYQLYDDVLALKDETQKKLVSKWLKGKSDMYVLNIDYGAEKGRKHFHAVFGTNDKIPYKSLESNITLELIPNRLDDKERISKYITKLSAHAVKLSTKNQRLTYWKRKVK